MSDTLLKYREAIDTYQPIEAEGFTWYPIKVREHDAFMNARPAIEFLQQSLPVSYLSMPLLSAFFAVELQNKLDGKPSDGLFFRALLFLCLSLRFRTDLPLMERVERMANSVIVDAKNNARLIAVSIEMDGEEKRLTPVQFQRLRPILAAQNGIKLESDDSNPELVQAERDIAEQNAPDLDYDIKHEIAFLSALSGTDESEVYDWPILKLRNRVGAFERVLGYLTFTIGELGGNVKYTHGNPVPSPVFPKAKRESSALIDMERFTRGQNVSVSEAPPAVPVQQTETQL